LENIENRRELIRQNLSEARTRQKKIIREISFIAYMSKP